MRANYRPYALKKKKNSCYFLKTGGRSQNSLIKKATHAQGNFTCRNAEPGITVNAMI
jgi:hypothetical protein